MTPEEITAEQNLLAAIIEAPDDDAPRLVYADWLLSRNDARGELIQLQVQRAIAPEERRRAIKIAENKLLAAHGTAWLEPMLAVLPPAPEWVPHKLELVRGFVEEAELSLACLPRLGRLWELAPLLRRLKIYPAMFVGDKPTQPHIEGELAAPYFARLRALELSLGGAGNAAAKVIAASPTLSNLRELQLHLSVWGEGIGYYGIPAEQLVLDDEGARVLATSPHLVNVEHLLLDSNRITCAGLAALAHGAWRIRRLDLGHNLLDGNAVARSLEGPAFENLEILGLSGITFDAGAIAELVRSPMLRNLRELDLEKCHLGVEGTKALCDAFALPSLRRLRLERNSLCDAGAIAIGSCERLANLTSFEAGHNRIGQKGAAAIAGSPYFANLERLTLNEPRWKPETAALLAASPTLANTKIYLQGRLVARSSKKSAAEAAAAAAAEEKPKPKRATKSSGDGATKPKPARVTKAPGDATKPKPAKRTTTKPE